MILMMDIRGVVHRVEAMRHRVDHSVRVLSHRVSHALRVRRHMVSHTVMQSQNSAREASIRRTCGIVDQSRRGLAGRRME